MSRQSGALSGPPRPQQPSRTAAACLGLGAAYFQLEQLPAASPAYFRAAGAVGKLTMPHEMGELFKVMALGRGVDQHLLGFTRGDQSHRL